ncbi:MAG: VOC family protein [Immundisolibacter sp.]|uniref:VOC family protein n=1 Tax=Immundisolibacter sp. TaxID=1934948 RepID=UPI003D147FE5
MSLQPGDFDRFGVIVRDLPAAMAAYARVFGIREFDLCEIDGRPAALGGLGSLRLELIEGSGGGDVCGEFFERRGAGMSHAVFAGRGREPLARVAERAIAHRLAVEPSSARLTIASRAQLGGLAIAVEQVPPQVLGRRSFSHIALLPCQKLFHVGMVVRDRELAIGGFQRLLGIDEFLRMELHTDHGLRVWIDAQPVAHHARTAFGRVGSFSCELMEPLGGDGLYQRFLAAHGEGPQHYFPTILNPADFAAVRAGVARAGLTVRLEGAIGDAMRYYYLDSAPLMGLCIEIIVAERPDWWQSLGMSAQDAWRVGLDV